MKMIKVSLTKHLKLGLPNYSNVTVGCSIEWEIGEKEEMDFRQAWDVINQQLSIQADQGTDPSWITYDETNKKYKVTVHSPKE